MMPKERHGFEERGYRREGGKSEPPGRRGPGGERHMHGDGARAGGRGRGRAQRGDVRTAILLMLAEEPMHGYQIMQAISDRTGGAWRASAGAVYPTIAQLEDEGLVTTRKEDGRRLVTLTAEGRTYLEERRSRVGDPFAGFANAADRPDLRDPLHELHAAARQIAAGGNVSQVEAAARVLSQARRSLYLILAGETEAADE